MVDSTRTAEVSLVNRTEINDLPINGRRADQFALLVPDVTRDGTFGQISYRGFSGVFNNFTIEGNDDNEAYNATARGNTAIITASNLNFSTPDGTQYGGFGNGIYGQGGLSLLPTIERNSNTGDASSRMDLRLARDVRVTDRLVIDVLPEGLNIFNADIWTQYNNTVYQATATTAATTTSSTPVLLTPTTNFG